MPGLTEEELRKLFARYDKNDNGTLSWDEFCPMLDELLGTKTLEEKCLAFNLVDTDHSGMISFEEFAAWWNKQYVKNND